MDEWPRRFTLSFKLRGPENFLEWRSELRAYMSFLRSNELHVEEKLLLYQIKLTMDRFPLSQIHGLERISEVWSRLNELFLPQCSLEDLLGAAKSQDWLSNGLSKVFRYYWDTGKQEYEKKNWEEASRCFFATQTIALYYWKTGDGETYLALDVAETTAFYVCANMHRGVIDHEAIMNLLTNFQDNVVGNVSNQKVVQLLDLVVNAFSKQGYLHFSIFYVREMFQLSSCGVVRILIGLKLSAFLERIDMIKSAYQMLYHVCSYYRKHIADNGPLKDITRKRIDYLGSLAVEKGIFEASFVERSFEAGFVEIGIDEAGASIDFFLPSAVTKRLEEALRERKARLEEQEEKAGRNEKDGQVYFYDVRNGK